MEADSKTRADVDCMMLDYLVCIAIDALLSQPRRPEQDVNWLVDSVRALESTILTQPDPDLAIKLRLFSVADLHRRYIAAAQRGSHEDRLPSLALIGTEFMNLCLAASHKVSESRWFDIGSRLISQAKLDEGRTPALLTFKNWASGVPNIDSQWKRKYTKYAGMRHTLTELDGIVLEFFSDLMATLDAPILIQLERGKLGNLSRVETQELKARVGMR
ncbi:uncharacterized protein PFLUO_LOCUS838 [Penicillium psychrofluorescens]|uniref:uncharacterized protein n=1 Tax=Penicillium psychrofluorescens TaxID=3158075 RepID=UPI003CCD91FA